MRTIKVNKAVNQAMNRVGEVLFRPFNLGKWFVLGFCAFLANLASGNSSFHFQFGGNGLQSLFQALGGPGPNEQIDAWFSQHFWGIISVVGIFTVAGLIVIALVMWLQSRGTFMFIHGVATNQASVVESWKQHRRLGNSLFLMRFLVLIVTGVVGLAGSGIALWIAWPDLQAGQFGDLAEAGLLTWVIWIVLVVFGYLQMSSLFTQFVSPVMYAGDITAGPAIKRVWRDMIVGQFWAVTRFYLMLGVLAMAVGIVAGMLVCMTACLVLVPYVGTVILLPIFVFMRSYSLYFVDQFGEAYRVFPIDVDSPTCSVCGYDLRGNPHALACPECGQPIDEATAAALLENHNEANPAGA